MGRYMTLPDGTRFDLDEEIELSDGTWIRLGAATREQLGDHGALMRQRRADQLAGACSDWSSASNMTKPPSTPSTTCQPGLHSRRSPPSSWGLEAVEQAQLVGQPVDPREWVESERSAARMVRSNSTAVLLHSTVGSRFAAVLSLPKYLNIVPLWR